MDRLDETDDFEERLRRRLEFEANGFLAPSVDTIVLVGQARKRRRVSWIAGSFIAVLAMGGIAVIASALASPDPTSAASNSGAECATAWTGAEVVRTLETDLATIRDDALKLGETIPSEWQNLGERSVAEYCFLSLGSPRSDPRRFTLAIVPGHEGSVVLANVAAMGAELAPQPATWRLASPNTPESSETHFEILVQELSCAGGTSPSGELANRM